MQNQIRSNEYRYTLVCVDSYDKRVLTGRYYNPYLKEGELFESLMEFLIKMEKTLDQMKFPQTGGTVKTFAARPEPGWSGLPEPERQHGAAGTFLLKVLFRQNASWQGSLLWMEGKKEQSFRSLLELVLLLDCALNAEDGKEP